MEVLQKILENNNWLNGITDYLDGDPSAILDKSEKFDRIIEYKELKKLFKDLKEYDGAYRYRNLIFMNDWNYGCFVYTEDDPEDYVEHLTLDEMSFESFMESITPFLV